jgi:hypothetical protein
MLTRSMTATVTGRAAAARRLRRRATTVSGRLYCITNGCTTFLVIDPESGSARCPVCQATRRNG